MTAVTPSMFMGMRPRPALADRVFDRAADRREPSAYCALAGGVVDERKQAGRPGIERVPSMPEAGHVLLAGVATPPQHGASRSREVLDVCELCVDLEVELHALLARAAVDIVEDVDGRRHRAVDPAPQVTAIRAIAIEGAWGPWSTDATIAASSSAASARVGSSPRSISQIVSTKPALPISSWIG